MAQSTPQPPLRTALLALAAGTCLSAPAFGAPVATTWPVAGQNDTACVAAASVAGWYAAGDTYQDQVEIRDIRGTLLRTITKSDISALCPWMALDGGPDGPSALAFSASGHLLFILVHDDTIDAILRYDVAANTLTRPARIDLYDRGDLFPHLAAAHYKGFLYVSVPGGQVAIFSAQAGSGNSSPSATWTLPGSGAGVLVHGLAIDRDLGVLYAATDTGVYRATIPTSGLAQPSFSSLASGVDIRGLAWGDHYGAAAQRGLYILSGSGASGAKIDFIANAQVGGTGVVPTAYTSSPTPWHSIAPTADGRLLVGADEDAVMLADSADTRLGFDAFLADEFNQVTTFARGLISPDGEPAGWVIDADVTPGASRFHPATPDGAAFTVLLLLMSDRLTGDPNAKAQVRTVLTRYGGLAPDGIKPSRTAEGIFRHWIDPLTGGVKSGWDPEYATLSTMLIVTAAARAMAYYPDDAAINLAASRIIFRTINWSRYLLGTNGLYFKGLAGGGPDTSASSAPYFEGILFVEQAGVYGGATAASARWFNASAYGSTLATWLAGFPMISSSPNYFQPAFTTLYPALVSAPFRADPAWRTDVNNVRWSNAAWTDDNPGRYYTVFSAGTSPSGYNADSLTNHPGNVATFTSLEALSAFGNTSEAVGAYAAYRKGARQSWKTGASMLYRRPTDATTFFVPNSAGLPDVALGALGLAELIQPGSIDAVLARPYPTTEFCPVDVNGDGLIDTEDLYASFATPTDLNGDGVASAADRACLRAWLRRRESGDATGR